MRRHPAQSGFTLIEVLAALAVFSIAAIGLSRVITETTRGASISEQKILAGIVAENQLAEAFMAPLPLQPGASSGTANQLGKEFNWIQTIGPTNRADVVAISVSVQDPFTNQILSELQLLRKTEQ